MLSTLLFDLDGTLVDSEPLHYEAHRQALQTVGIKLLLDEYIKNGVSTNKHEFYKKMSELKSVLFDTEAVGAEKVRLYKSLATSHLSLFPSTESVLEDLHSRYVLYIVTSTSRASAEHVLDLLGIRKFFKDIFSAHDSLRGKPFPDVYRDSLTAIGLAPEDCIAIEDSQNGVDSAYGAGVRCVAIPNRFTESQNFSHASWMLRDLSELPEHLKSIA